MNLFERSHLRISPVVAGVLLAMLFFGLPGQPTRAAGPANSWQDTGASFKTDDLNQYTCFDGLQPDRIFTGNLYYQLPTTVTDLRTRQRTEMNIRSYNLCNEMTGNLYSNAFLLNSDNPAGKFIDHNPTVVASDGSSWVYSQKFEVDGPVVKNWLYASPDAGLTWQESNISGFQGELQYLTVAKADGQVLYALSKDKVGPNRRYTLYASTNAGGSWEKRSEQVYDGDNGIFTPSLSFDEQFPKTAPANYIKMTRSQGGGSTGTTAFMVSIDGGRTFTDAGINSYGDSFYQIYYSDNALVRLRQGETGTDLTRSFDGGKTWMAAPLPFIPEPYNPSSQFSELQILQPQGAPNNLFLNYADGVKGDIWHSPDGGQTWEDFAPNMPKIKFSPYAPTFAVSFKDDKIYRLNLSSIDKTQTKVVAFNTGPDTDYHIDSGHNLSGLFKKYWDDHGGLAQFGLPWTEPFREVNAETGKVYTVQYFERNRFEYHPENAGTPYEVLLGLLGSNQTANRHNETPFRPVPDPKQAGFTYFAQTGHTLAHTFKQYWEANGGLALYGYPISEEFEELNPDDGKTYVVQYFERNRFEYHPENKGTRYEVLLGLLGNTLLKSKGWL